MQVTGAVGYTQPVPPSLKPDLRAVRTQPRPAPRTRLLVGLGVALVLILGVLWVTRSSEPRTRPANESSWTPVETLEAFIDAQEAGDIDAIARLITSESRTEFEETARGMTHDDLVAAGLQFRQEEYRLEEQTKESAVFYSPTSALYLAMSREDGRWRVDPARTDKLNRER